ncbi:cbb3-type cytochrome oxidase assembly protein CcoS [Faunimonas sp. B44]|uniref:cbb3-type cytochrome oxidase assembly protein CcoS n=1 Tax=Faunimonas sp. B44 TaxID=3461493 RepID=UPI004044716F
MSALGYLIPISIALGLVALGAFFWSLRTGQYEDLDGAAERILLNEDVPIPPSARQPASTGADHGAPLRRRE